jgi:hypothetical protein
MNLPWNTYLFSESLVTPKGIKFIDRFYSCPIAIREQWYDRAAVSGEWKLPISFNPFNPEIIVFFLESKGLQLAYRIEQFVIIDQEEQLAYSHKLRILSYRYRRMKKNKHKKFHLPNDAS